MTVQVQDIAPVVFSPRRIGHANLFVGDLEKSMHFYGAICGFEEVFREEHIGAGFLSGGALGNALDRVIYGSVVDFLDFHWNDIHFPTFNFADTFITFGVILIFFANFRKSN